MRITVLLTMVLAAVLGACSKQEAPKPQATSTATMGDKTVKLPKPGDTYKVLGAIPGLKNFLVKYDDNVIRGGMPTAMEGMEALKKHGIKTIISITPEDLERLGTEKLGIKLVTIEFGEDGVPDECLDKFVKTLKTEQGPFYVHCHGGSHRGGTLCYAYRTIVQGWKCKKAEAEFQALGGDPLKDKELLKSVCDYRAKLNATDTVKTTK